jgi:hypothetical protein
MGGPSRRMIPTLECDELSEREPRILWHIGRDYLEKAKQVDCHQSLICDSFFWNIQRLFQSLQGQAILLLRARPQRRSMVDVRYASQPGSLYNSSEGMIRRAVRERLCKPMVRSVRDKRFVAGIVLGEKEVGCEVTDRLVKRLW